MTKLLYAEQKIETLIGEIYDACLDPSLWRSAQDKICRATDGVGSHIVVFDQNPAPIETIIFSSLGQDFANSMEEDYFNWYYQFDDYRVQQATKQIKGMVFSHDELMPSEKRKSCPIYNEYFRNYEAQEQLIYASPIGKQRSVTFCQARPHGGQGYSFEQKKLYGRLSDHLAHSLGMREKVVAMFGAKQSLQDLILGDQNGIVVVNEQSTVMWANQKAEAMFIRGDNVSISSGMLRVSDIHQRQQIDKLITQAVQLGELRKDRCGFTTVNNQGQHLVLSVFSSSVDAAFFSDRKAVVVLVFHNPKESEIPPVSLIQSYFNLTNAEAKIAHALARDLTIKEYAKEAGVKEITVRSTLKLIRHKMSCHSQSQIVKAIMALTI